jgi:protein TonB
MTTQQEKKNQRIAMFTSIGVHTALFLLFLFMVAWKAPNPPNPEYGIELNFGTDNQGTGDVQPKEPVGSQGTREEEPDQPEPEKVTPQTETKIEETKPVETKPVEEEVVSKLESPVVVKEEKKPEVKPVEKVVEKKPEPKKEEVKPTVDEKAVYKPKTETNESANKSTETKAGEPGSHGDDKNKAGDKGSEQGKPDANALYGKQGGGGGGIGLNMTGWEWDQEPKIPKLPDNQNGKVEFEIWANEDGDIIKIITLERTLSPEAEKLIKQEIEKRSLIKKSAGAAFETSKGKVTYHLRLE